MRGFEADRLECGSRAYYWQPESEAGVNATPPLDPNSTTLYLKRRDILPNIFIFSNDRTIATFSNIFINFPMVHNAQIITILGDFILRNAVQS